MWTPKRTYKDDHPDAPPRRFDRKQIRASRLSIVHEDQDLIVVQKATGVPTAGTPTAGGTTLLAMVRQHVVENGPRMPRRQLKERKFLAEEMGMPDPERVPPVGVIHRLDKEASGLVVFSKSERGFIWLKDDFKSKRAKRNYMAVVEGTFGMPGQTGTLSSLLTEDETGLVRSVPATQTGNGGLGSQANRGVGESGRAGGEDEDDGPAARAATTFFRVIRTGKNNTLLALSLHTGRKHQIRVHLAEAGHPIVGDERYGARTDPMKRLALHATDLAFAHPGSGQACEFVSPAPGAFYRAVGEVPPPDSEHAARSGLMQRPSSQDKQKAGRVANATSWENVATWYDAMIDEQRNDHYANVILPGTLRMLSPAAGQRMLDLACGQGVLSRMLAQLGCEVVGVDAAPSLVAAAKSRSRSERTPNRPEFLVGDATGLDALKLKPASFDSVICVMALANMDPLEPVFAAVRTLLVPGGKLVFVITHPAFRGHGQTSWGWDDRSGVQFRRVDGYLSSGSKQIQMHPGQAPDVMTTTFHRPLQTYIRQLAGAGLAVTDLQEWPALRHSQPGPRAEAENRSRREIPLFLAITATALNDAPRHTTPSTVH